MYNLLKIKCINMLKSVAEIEDIMAYVYVVEDDKNISEIESFALKNSGYEVRGFEYEKDFYAALDAQIPDLVLLDPMFPERQKSALVKKKFQLIHRLEFPCMEEETLLNAAIAAGPRKILIKRPLKGPWLAGRNPGYSISGKAVRYDCILLPRD